MTRFGHAALSERSTPRRPGIETGRIWDQRTRAIEWHTHTRHELNWGFTGRRVVETEGTTWAMPATVGVWIPAGVRHAGMAGAGSTHFYTLIDPAAHGTKFRAPTVVAIPPAARELLLHLRDHDLEPGERFDVERTTIALLKPVCDSGVPLPAPTDARARVVAVAVVAEPGDRRTTEQWATEVGIAARTLDRLFLAETALSFTQWRIQARVRAATVLLADGESVADVAREMGYLNASAFVRAFRRTTGMTPRAYVDSFATTGIPDARPLNRQFDLVMC